MALSKEEEDFVGRVFEACTGLSFVGSFFVVTTIAYHRNDPKLQKFAYHLILMVVLSDICFEISTWFGGPESGEAACATSVFFLFWFIRS